LPRQGSSTPAAADAWRGGGHWGGGGHWHGGYWGGGGYGWGPGVGLDIAGGLAAGAIIGSAYPYYYNGYGYGYGYGEGCLAYQPIYDQFGNYIGRRAVNACH
jgi:hypothetical protein